MCVQAVSALKSGLEKLDKERSIESGSAPPDPPTTTTTTVVERENTTDFNTTTDRTDSSTTDRENHARASLSPPRLSPSPSSPAELRSYLDHLPEMNLPWQPLRTAIRCSCGRAFTFLVSKVRSGSHSPHTLTIVTPSPTHSITVPTAAQ